MTEDNKDKGQPANNLISGEQRLLKKDNAGYFVFRKASRLVTALYLITDGMPLDEPLRFELRTRGLESLSFMVSWREVRVSNSIDQGVLRGTITALLSLLEVGVLAGHISPMNRDMLDREYREILSFITTIDEQRRDVGPQFKGTFFATGEPNSIQSAEAMDSESVVEWGGEMWDTLNERHHKGQIGTTFFEQPHHRDIPSLRQKERRHPAVNKRQSGGASKQSRRTAILSLVEKRGRVSIKDVSSAVDDCSEKTLQRELLSLVDEGVLKKEGERRWSTYVLVRK